MNEEGTIYARSIMFSWPGTVFSIILKVNWKVKGCYDFTVLYYRSFSPLAEAIRARSFSPYECSAKKP
jgi:hypothetical protein